MNHKPTIGNSECQLPIPVQVFPTTDDFTYEKEKQAAANLANEFFARYEAAFLASLSNVSSEVEDHVAEFFDNIQRAAKSTGKRRSVYVGDSLAELLNCSPKKILAEFQRQSLAAGWAYVSIYNQAIDRLAELYPRCRAGIYGSRLKYSDVLQIASEIIETVRSCSTLLDDLQRRFDLLESLQNNIQSDIDTPEVELIMTAMKETFADNERYGRHAEVELEESIKKATALLMQPFTAIGDVMALPTLQIQGQMQRTRRMVVFLETAQMFAEGWREWKSASAEIIEPNIKVMFMLKQDYFKNQMVCLCDVISCNGYSLDGLANHLKTIASTSSITPITKNVSRIRK